MNTYTKAVFPGKYIQGEDAVTELPDFLALFGEKPLILAAPSAFESCIPRFQEQLGGDAVVETFNRECSETELKRVQTVISENRIDVVAGIGGGKVIDTAKIAAGRTGCRVVIVPTIASTDAPCSGCAIIYSDDGVFESVSYQRNNPDLVLMDTRIIAEAPVRFLVSGMGDALATWFEARSCRRSHSLNECGGYSTLTGIALSELCFKTLIQYGPGAKVACEKKVVTPALEHIIEANTLLSGLGFESSGLAAAHAIHNGLTALPQTHGMFHGEKVAFGTLAGLHLTDADSSEIEDVYTFCETIGLPTTLADIGLTEWTKDELRVVAEKTCEKQESVHHEAEPVTADQVLSALIMADAMGRQRKQG